MSPYDITDAKEDIQILYAICGGFDKKVTDAGGESIFDQVKAQLGKGIAEPDEDKKNSKKKGFGTK